MCVLSMSLHGENFTCSLPFCDLQAGSGGILGSELGSGGRIAAAIVAEASNNHQGLQPAPAPSQPTLDQQDVAWEDADTAPAVAADSGVKQEDGEIAPTAAASSNQRGLRSDMAAQAADQSRPTGSADLEWEDAEPAPALAAATTEQGSVPKAAPATGCAGRAGHVHKAERDVKLEDAQPVSAVPAAAAAGAAPSAQAEAEPQLATTAVTDAEAPHPPEQAPPAKRRRLRKATEAQPVSGAHPATGVFADTGSDGERACTEEGIELKFTFVS